MNFLVSNLPVFHVFALAAAFSWVYGGLDGPALAPWTPWVAFFLLEAMFFPQCRDGESFAEARSRAWKGMLSDPLFYVAAILAVAMAIPFFNVSPCWICDADKLAPGAAAEYVNAPVEWLPKCMHPDRHRSVFNWFVLPLFGALTAKHALRRRGKRALLELLCWNGALLAALGFVQAATGAEAPLWSEVVPPPTIPAKYVAGYRLQFFSSFAYPNAAAGFFAALFAVSCGIWQSKYAFFESLPSHKEFEHVKPPKHQFLRSHYMIAVAVMNLLGALHTGSRAGVYSSIALSVVMAVHIFSGYFQKADRLGKAKTLAAFVGLLALVSLAVVAFGPDGAAEDGGGESAKAEEAASAPEAAANGETKAKARPAAPGGKPGAAKKPAPAARKEEKKDREPESLLAKGLDDVRNTSAVSFWDRLSGRVPNLGSEIAWKLVKDNPWFGVGGWGFIDNCAWMVTPYARNRWPELDDAGWENLHKRWTREIDGPWTSGGANVHNDYLQILCEHGATGAFLLGFAMLLLMKPVFSAWKRLYKMTAFSKSGMPAKPYALYVLPTPVFGTILGSAVLFIQAMADCPLRCAANTALLALVWVAAEGFLPKEEKV